jgi:hypothetical protein
MGEPRAELPFTGDQVGLFRAQPGRRKLCQGVTRPKLSSIVRTFTDPDAYFAEIRNLQAAGLVTQRGRFRAELTYIDLHGLWMHRFNEDLSQIIRVTPCGKQAQIIFATDPDQPAMLANGMETSQNQIAQFGLRWDWYLRSSAASGWGAVSLTSEHLAAAGRTIVGRELTPPTFMHVMTPPVQSFSRLLKVHEAAAGLLIRGKGGARLTSLRQRPHGMWDTHRPRGRRTPDLFLSRIICRNSIKVRSCGVHRPGDTARLVLTLHLLKGVRSAARIALLIGYRSFSRRKEKTVVGYAEAHFGIPPMTSI